MAVIVTPDCFDPWQEIQRHQQAADWTGLYGATSVFVGTMRDVNDGDAVNGMTLEHYPGMTEKQLQRIIDEAMRQWSILDCLVVHRVGDIAPDDAIVLVAVWASHRGDACDACRHIIEALKSSAPFWKKERLAANAERWVSANSNGYAPLSNR